MTRNTQRDAKALGMAHHPRPLKPSGYRLACSHAAGFTLIEAVIAGFVLGFGLSAVTRLQADLLIESHEKKSLAEALRLQVSLDSPAVTPTSGQRKRIGSMRPTILNGRVTRYQSNVFCQAQAQVLWTDRPGPETVELATLIADPECLVTGQLFLIAPPPGP